MNLRRPSLVGLALVGVSLVASALAYPGIPAEMATHWNDGVRFELMQALAPALGAPVPDYAVHLVAGSVAAVSPYATVYSDVEYLRVAA